MPAHNRLVSVTPGRAPRRADLAIGAGAWAFACALLLLAPLLDSTSGETTIGIGHVGAVDWWLTVLTISLQAVALWWARAAPRTVLLLVCCLPLLASGVLGEAALSLTRPAVAVAVVYAGSMLPLRDSRPIYAAAVLLVAAGEVTSRMVVGHDGALAAVSLAVPQTIAVVIAPLLLASMFAARRAAREAAAGELRALARERDALVAAAVAQERTAMARELHDIAAHHLSGIAVMAAAVDHQIDTDPEAARRSVRAVRSQSKAVLDDLRRLVGLLREDVDDERSAQTLASTVQLVDDRRAAGLPIQARTRVGDTGGRLGAGVGPLAQLVAYRMVQESLTNAAVHAPGAPCLVEIDDRHPGTVTVTVTNDRPPTTGEPPDAGRGGFGLLGMRERAGLVAATLRYGATADGGWAVVLTIPRDSSIEPADQSTETEA